MNTTILVTGGAGYIGSHACKALAQAGYVPVVYDNLLCGHPWAVKWGSLEQGDIMDRNRLDAVIIKYQPQAIMHFAAHAYVGESVTNPGKYFRNNVVGSLNILESMRDHGIRKFIFSSSCATYGIPTTLPINESSPQLPVNPYGASKMMIERMLADFTTAHGVRSVSLRYFNAAGADPAGEIGEDHHPETHLIPLAISAIQGRHSYLEVYGTDYDTPDGTAVRDYVHVTDLADAHVKALGYLLKGGESTAVNLGTGHGFSVREVIDTISRITGREVPFRLSQRRPGDPPILVADATYGMNLLNWKPSYSELAQIVQTSWMWHQKQRQF